MGRDACLYCLVDKPLTSEEIVRWTYEAREALGPDEFMRIVPVADEDRMYELVNGWRWYGEGYHRGDMLLIYGAFRWLEARSQSVWYAQDGEGYYGQEPTRRAHMDDLLAIWAEVGRRPWREEIREDSPVCSECKYPMTSFYQGWTCFGCGALIPHGQRPVSDGEGA